MPACCSTFERAAEQQFNEKKAAAELKRYPTKGPGPTTRLLQEGIARAGAMNGTLLDVGSGARWGPGLFRDFLVFYDELESSPG